MEQQRLIMDQQDENRNKLLKDKKIQQQKIVDKKNSKVLNRVDVEREKLDLIGEELNKEKERKFIEKEAKKKIEEKNNKISLRSFLFSQMDFKKKNEGLEKISDKYFKEKWDKEYEEDLKEKKETNDRVRILNFLF